ncbi:MAG: VIT1/CCC1 transporter family protein [Nitrospirota bacterium]
MADFFRHRLRDAVFGTQDGLVSTLGALTGIAAGTQDGRVVIVAGLVVVAVEALSMAGGSYLSSKSQRQYLERMLREERQAIADHPDTERQEIREMYRARGYSEPEIEMIADRLLADPALLLEDMAHKELGICPATLEQPLGNAAVMGAAYITGGLVPVAPYMLLPLGNAMTLSVVTTGLALLALGIWKGRIVGVSWWRSGLEVLAIAGLATAVGFLIGQIVRLML